MKQLKNMPIKPSSKVLYLGVASGTSCSHVSDIVGDGGHVWALDFAPRALRDLLDKVSRFRENISPILGDARIPGSYAMLVPEIDVIFADVAQPDQAEIAVKNADFFLKRMGWVMLSIKSRSIDVRESPEKIFNDQVTVLEQGGLNVKELVNLDPFEKDHAMAVAQFV
jgi:fibrillarin-like pre-rRNA processing protein